MSGRRTNAEGTIERALDGWDLRADYHLPIDHDVNVFVSAFEFENTESVSSYKETGNKYGLDAKVGNFAIEAGYMDDNQENDAYFGNVKYVVNFGSDNQDHSSSNSKSLADVSDRLYEPVKRENKIRVVKIDASGVVVGGF
jgi:adhesin/invasin